MVGPADLALSMGFHPREAPNRKEHVRALEDVVQVCRNADKFPGIDTGTPDSAAKRVEQEFRFIPMGNDAKFLVGSAAAGLKMAKQAAAKS